MTTPTHKPKQRKSSETPINRITKRQKVISASLEKSKIESQTKAKDHNSVEYYIKGDELDTAEAKIVKIYNNIYFYSPITRTSATTLIETLIQIDHKNIERIHSSDGGDSLRPIRIHMLSEGGDIFAALSIYQTIKTLKSPVEGYINGFVSSASIIVLLACSFRYMYSNSFIGIQSMKMTVWGKLEHLRRCNQNYKLIWKSLEELYRTNTKLEQNNENIEKFMGESKLLDANTALHHGFVTHVINQ